MTGRELENRRVPASGGHKSIPPEPLIQPIPKMGYNSKNIVAAITKGINLYVTPHFSSKMRGRPILN